MFNKKRALQGLEPIELDDSFLGKDEGDHIDVDGVPLLKTKYF